jgi:threonine synthase
MRESKQLDGLVCLHCSAAYPLSLQHEGCSQCRARGLFVSLGASYRREADQYRYLPYEPIVTLGEGNTPLADSATLAHWLGVRQFSIKDESSNPTGSHKDRMSAMGLSQAMDCGVKTVVLASSGNAALSAATYAKKAGIACEVATYGEIGGGFQPLFKDLGIQVFHFEDNPSRWAFVRSRAQLEGYFALTNYSLPAIGSAPLAIEGYKAIAYENFEQGCRPDHIIVPTARGDLLWGIFAGYRDLLLAKKIGRLPRLWLVEPFARMESVLSLAAIKRDAQPPAELHSNFVGQTVQFSTAGHTATYLQWQAVTASGGGAVTVGDEAAFSARTMMAGYFPPVELCAGAGLAAGHALVERGAIRATDHVMLVVTAKAERDPTWTILQSPSQSNGAPHV